MKGGVGVRGGEGVCGEKGGVGVRGGEGVCGEKGDAGVCERADG